jgi:hypothetical protein
MQANRVAGAKIFEQGPCIRCSSHAGPEQACTVDRQLACAEEGANKLIVDPGAVFNANVNGGGGSLELTAGTGSIGLIGSSAFSNFMTLTDDANALWRLTGANTMANVVDNAFNLGRAVVRKDWLSVRKEALVSVSDARHARVTHPPLRLLPIRGSS